MTDQQADLMTGTNDGSPYTPAVRGICQLPPASGAQVVALEPPSRMLSLRLRLNPKPRCDARQVLSQEFSSMTHCSIALLSVSQRSAFGRVLSKFSSRRIEHVEL